MGGKGSKCCKNSESDPLIDASGRSVRSVSSDGGHTPERRSPSPSSNMSMGRRHAHPPRRGSQDDADADPAFRTPPRRRRKRDKDDPPDDPNPAIFYASSTKLSKPRRKTSVRGELEERARANAELEAMEEGAASQSLHEEEEDEEGEEGDGRGVTGTIVSFSPSAATSGSPNSRDGQSAAGSSRGRRRTRAGEELVLLHSHGGSYGAADDDDSPSSTKASHGGRTRSPKRGVAERGKAAAAAFWWKRNACVVGACVVFALVVALAVVLAMTLGVVGVDASGGGGRGAGWGGGGGTAAEGAAASNPDGIGTRIEVRAPVGGGG